MDEWRGEICKKRDRQINRKSSKKGGIRREIRQREEKIGYKCLNITAPKNLNNFITNYYFFIKSVNSRPCA